MRLRRRSLHRFIPNRAAPTSMGVSDSLRFGDSSQDGDLSSASSPAAMALTFAFYAAPSFSRPLAIGAVVVLTAVNYFGVTTTALLTRVIVTVVLASLAVVVAAVVFGGEADVRRLQMLTNSGLYGVLQAAGLLFFA